MEHMQEQVSMTMDDCEILVADSESDSSSPPSEQFGFFTRRNDMVQVDEGNNEYKIIKNCFINGMGPFRKDTKVVAIHRNSCSGLSGKARLETFRIFSEAVEKKCGGDSNMKFAWYGGSKNEIRDIISHGFTRPENRGLYGIGVYLSPAKFSMDSALLSDDDDDNGLRHILLCRVILGKMEQICKGSKQFRPSSEEFDSGVDDLAEPRRYVVWSSYMNSHILPSFMISFKASSSIGSQRNRQGSSFLPKSPFMSFPNLMSMLAKYLRPSEMDLIAKYHLAFRENKITRPQVIRKVRQIAGDDLLKAVIKLSMNKQLEAIDGRCYGAAATNSDRLIPE